VRAITALSKRRTVAPTTLSFEGQTNWARPANPAGRSVTFTTKAGLDSAVNGLLAGDTVTYVGTSVLPIISSTSTTYKITKSPSSVAVFDFGTSRSIWDPTKVSNAYVSFSFTGATNNFAFWINGCSNLRFFGGDLDTDSTGGSGLLVGAPTQAVLWYDLTTHDVGASGIAVRGTTGSGTASDVHDLTIRAECDRFCMNPSFDNHPDKGTGFHGLILHGSTGDIHDSTFAIYAHDPLRPGEQTTINGVTQTWPEGGGGCAIEPGNDSGLVPNYNNCTYYALGVNLLMRVGDGHNPGSSLTNIQTGGNVFNFWGAIPLSNNVVGWAEGRNCTGAVIHGNPNSNWQNGAIPIKVLHGRHTNVNQWTGKGGQISIPYDDRFTFVYSADCL
jgi:hypothetical protein